MSCVKVKTGVITKDERHTYIIAFFDWRVTFQERYLSHGGSRRAMNT